MKHAIKTIKIDLTQGNIVETALPVGARIIGGHIAIEDPKLVLAGRARPNSIVPAVVVYYDAEEQRTESRQLVVLVSGKEGVAIEYGALTPVCTIAKPGGAEVYTVFEAVRVAAVERERIDGGRS